MIRRKLLAMAFSVVGLGGIASAAYIQSTIAQYEYSAPCYKLKGIAGILQANNFIPTGGCQVDVAKGGCHDTRVCQISNPSGGGSAANGHCTPVNNGTDCQCTLDKPGKP